MVVDPLWICAIERCADDSSAGFGIGAEIEEDQFVARGDGGDAESVERKRPSAPLLETMNKCLATGAAGPVGGIDDRLAIGSKKDVADVPEVETEPAEL